MKVKGRGEDEEMKRKKRGGDRPPSLLFPPPLSPLPFLLFLTSCSFLVLLSPSSSLPCSLRTFPFLFCSFSCWLILSPPPLPLASFSPPFSSLHDTPPVIVLFFTSPLSSSSFSHLLSLSSFSLFSPSILLHHLLSTSLFLSLPHFSSSTSTCFPLLLFPLL